MTMFPNRYEQPVFSILVGATLSALLVLLVVLTVNNIRTGLAFDESSTDNQITVEGTGEVEATPDLASIRVEVEKRADTSEEAQAEVSTIINNVIERLKLAGVEEADIKTDWVNVYENEIYDIDADRFEADGWIAFHSLNVNVKDVKQVSQLMELSRDAGATMISGPNFTLDDTDPYLAQARESAIKDARKKAEVIADSLGLKVGKVVDYYEYEGFNGPYYDTMSSMGYEDIKLSDSVMEIETGSQTVSLNVSITFQMK